MYKYLTSFALFLTFVTSIGCMNTQAPEEEKQFVTNFINAITDERIPEKAIYYILIDSSREATFDRKNYEEHRTILISDYPDLPSNFEKDTAILNWDTYNLKRAKIISYKDHPRGYGLGIERKVSFVDYNTSESTIDSLNKLEHAHIYVPVKKEWSRAEKDTAVSRAWYKLFNSLKPENSIYYTFSKPVFSADKKYAIIFIGTGHGGCWHIYRNEEVKWKELSRFSCYIAN